MLADLFMTPGKGVAEQLTYWAHTFLPFSRWRKADRRGRRRGLRGSGTLRHFRTRCRPAPGVPGGPHGGAQPSRGDHLPDLTPDAYNAFSPTSCAKSHSGKKKIDGPAERRAKYLQHPQTLAYLLTPASLARKGLGGSAPGTIAGAPIGEAAPSAGVAGALQEQLGGKGGGSIDGFAEIVAMLHAGPPPQEEEPVAA